MALSLSISPPLLLFLLIFFHTHTATTTWGVAAASWCVARSVASNQALQTALDYACGAGADCAPIQSSGLCFLPNTIQAHASYAFNSFYQRKAMTPGSCDFSGTATIAKTDPSYGSCVYPSSLSTAGGTPTTATTGGGIPTTITNNPTTTTPTTTTPLYDGGGNGLTPGTTGPTTTTSTDESGVSKEFLGSMSLRIVLVLLVLSFTSRSS